MKQEKKQKENNENILTIKILVDDKADAFEIVSRLGFQYKVKSAKFKEFDEEFDENHTPKNFTRLKK